MQRHDELPPLSAAQQTEVLRLAARLQAEHESTTSFECLVRAAQEAGIEERFLQEAVERVAATPRPYGPTLQPASLWAAPALVLIAAALGALVPFFPPFPFVAFLGFLFALYPTLAGRSRLSVAGVSFVSWMSINLAMWAIQVDVRGEFTTVGLLEAVGLVLGMALAEMAVVARNTKALAQNRPQSLS